MSVNIKMSTSVDVDTVEGDFRDHSSRYASASVYWGSDYYRIDCNGLDAKFTHAQATRMFLDFVRTIEYNMDKGYEESDAALKTMQSLAVDVINVINDHQELFDELGLEIKSV